MEKIEFLNDTLSPLGTGLARMRTIYRSSLITIEATEGLWWSLLSIISDLQKC